MASILRPFIALYAAMFFMAMGLGLLATFLSLRLTIEGFSTQVTGMILTSYFMGSILGTFYCSRVIKSVGHIRSFTAFSALATAMVMLHGAHISAIGWAVFRFFTGFAVIGMFMVIESWLNECSQPQTRGRVFSIYMVMCYLGLSVGQQLLNFGDATTQALFFTVGFMLVACILPVAMTHTIHPEMPEVKPVDLKLIIKKAPMGLIGCLTAGLTASSFFTMGPVFCYQINLSVSQLSYFMTTTVLGGLLIQWPLGAISDRFDRSLVIPVSGLLFSIYSLVMILAAKSTYEALLGATVIFGGLLFSIYPTSVARAHDMFEPKDVVNVSSVLLLFYGIGAVMGPLVSSTVIELMGSPFGFYAYFACISLISASVSFLSRQKEIAKAIPVEDQVDFMIMKHTSQMVMQIDPRSEIIDDAKEKGADSTDPA